MMSARKQGAGAEVLAAEQDTVVESRERGVGYGGGGGGVGTGAEDNERGGDTGGGQRRDCDCGSHSTPQG